MNSQQRRLWAVQGFSRYLLKEGFTLSDPSAALERPKYRRPLPRGILNARQVLALLNAPDVKTTLGLRDRAILELLYATGIRNAEALTLRLQDLSMESRQIMVTGKGNKERAVPLGRITQTWLIEYLQLARPKLAGKRSPDNVFLTCRGRAFVRANLCQMVRKRAKEAGLPAHATPTRYGTRARRTSCRRARTSVSSRSFSVTPRFRRRKSIRTWTSRTSKRSMRPFIRGSRDERNPRAA